MGLMRVQYVGGSDYRHISAKDLKDLGITVVTEPPPPVIVTALADHGIKCEPNDLVWHVWNGWALQMDVTDGLERVFRQTGTFTLLAIQDDGSTVVEVTAADPARDDETGTIVDKTTGAQSSGSREE